MRHMPRRLDACFERSACRYCAIVLLLKLRAESLDIYLTAPVIPSVNCFCSTKKMIIVGIEQKRTPSIRTP